MTPFRPREFPVPSLTVFVSLQVLDILTTIMGLRLGANESSIFLARLMHAGPIAALLVAKLFAVFLAAAALRLERPRIIVFLNFWFAALVTWNLGMILLAAFMARR